MSRILLNQGLWIEISWQTSATSHSN